MTNILSTILSAILSAFVTALIFPMVAGWFGYAITITYLPLVGIFFVASVVSAAAIIAVTAVLVFIANI